jgi:hypothetical protein
MRQVLDVRREEWRHHRFEKAAFKFGRIQGTPENNKKVEIVIRFQSIFYKNVIPESYPAYLSYLQWHWNHCYIPKGINCPC